MTKTQIKNKAKKIAKQIREFDNKLVLIELEDIVKELDELNDDISEQSQGKESLEEIADTIDGLNTELGDILESIQSLCGVADSLEDLE